MEELEVSLDSQMEIYKILYGMASPGKEKERIEGLMNKRVEEMKQAERDFLLRVRSRSYGQRLRHP